MLKKLDFSILILLPQYRIMFSYCWVCSFSFLVFSRCIVMSQHNFSMFLPLFLSNLTNTSKLEVLSNIDVIISFVPKFDIEIPLVFPC